MQGTPHRQAYKADSPGRAFRQHVAARHAKDPYRSVRPSRFHWRLPLAPKGMPRARAGIENHCRFEGSIREGSAPMLRTDGGCPDYRAQTNLGCVQLEALWHPSCCGRRMSGPPRRQARSGIRNLHCLRGRSVADAGGRCRHRPHVQLVRRGIQNNLGSYQLGRGYPIGDTAWVFAGVLLLLSGLEPVGNTGKTYFSDYHVRTEVILIVAMIAVGRHIVQIDFEHMAPASLAGVAMLILALSISYLPARDRPAPSRVLATAPDREVEIIAPPRDSSRIVSGCHRPRGSVARSPVMA